MATRHRVGRWAGRRIGRRLEKSIPLVGTLFALAFLADAVRRKGMMRGLADTALNALPLVGTLKNGIEIFTDDWIPDRPPAASSASSAASPRRSTPGRRSRGE